jgi:hypothetical protein
MDKAFEAADNRSAAAFLLALGVPVCAVGAVALLRYPPADRALTALLVGLVFAPIVVPPGVLIVAGLVRQSAVARRIALLTLAVLSALAAGAMLNGRLDESPVREHRTRIHSKEVRSGRFTRHLLIVEPWGDHTVAGNRRELAVCSSTFKTLSPGEELAVYTRDGALGIPYVVALAPAACGLDQNPTHFPPLSTTRSMNRTPRAPSSTPGNSPFSPRTAAATPR